MSAGRVVGIKRFEQLLTQWFALRGWKPAPFQREVWRRYREGQSGLLVTPTGSGKTKVMSLALAWSYFHKLYEPESELSRNFLVIAPNIIVLDRIWPLGF